MRKNTQTFQNAMNRRQKPQNTRSRLTKKKHVHVIIDEMDFWVYRGL